MGSLVLASPDVLASAAQDVAGIGSAISEANAAAATSTTSVVAAADDEVSTAIAALFGNYGQRYQALSAQVALFHEQLAQAFNSSGLAYAATEAASASPLQALAQDGHSLAAFSPFSPWKDLTGRPLFGNGANGTAGSGQAGGPVGG